jgi:hypothetical protein
MTVAVGQEKAQRNRNGLEGQALKSIGSLAAGQSHAAHPAAKPANKRFAF